MIEWYREYADFMESRGIDEDMAFGEFISYMQSDEVILPEAVSFLLKNTGWLRYISSGGKDAYWERWFPKDGLKEPYGAFLQFYDTSLMFVVNVKLSLESTSDFKSFIQYLSQHKQFFDLRSVEMWYTKMPVKNRPYILEASGRYSEEDGLTYQVVSHPWKVDDECPF